MPIGASIGRLIERAMMNDRWLFLCRSDSVGERRFGVALSMTVLFFSSMLGASAWSQTTKQSPGVNVKTTDGQQTTGALVTIDGQLLELLSGGENQTLDFERIEQVEFAQPASAEETPRPALQCRLTDGSFINGQNIRIQGDVAKVEVSPQRHIEVGKSSLGAVLMFNPADDPQRLERWDAFAPTFTAASDAIVAEKNETLRAIEGVVGNVHEEGFEFQMDQRAATVKAEKLTGVLFYRAQRGIPDAVCFVELTGGSMVQAQQIVFLGEQLKLVARTGDQIELSIDLVRKLNFLAGRRIYLSDLLPTTNDWQPLVASPAVLGSLSKLKVATANQDASGQPLTIRWEKSNGATSASIEQSYDKGFAISGGGRLAFNLNGQFKRLTAIVGFAPSTQRLEGVVKFVVQADGKTKLESILKNRKLTHPLPVDIDVSNVNRLVIRVDYHDGRSIGDQIHIVDAKVFR